MAVAVAVSEGDGFGQIGHVALASVHYGFQLKIGQFSFVDNIGGHCKIVRDILLVWNN